MPAASSLEPGVLIEKLGYRPSYLLDAMIHMDSPQSLLFGSSTAMDIPQRVSSIGALDCLPPELISLVFDSLDVVSLSAFARVSHHAYNSVHSHRPFCDLVTFCAQALKALCRSGLGGLHSTRHLYKSLRFEKCATCVAYGAFLYLPTGERCCWQCLREHPLLRMLTLKEAKRYFGLLDRHVKQLSMLSVIPGTYDICSESVPGGSKLVSAQHAANAGLAIHGSTQGLADDLARRCKSYGFRCTGRFFHDGIALPSDQDHLFMPSQGNVPNDGYFGVASCPMPSLSRSGEVDSGLWCRGCRLVVEWYDHVRLPGDVLVSIVPRQLQRQRVLVGLERRAWSARSFLDHIQACYGARQLVPELAQHTNDIET